PAIAPVVSPRPLRPAVNEELHGIFLRGVKVRRLDHKALNFVVVSAGEPEGFELGHGDLGEDRVVAVSQLSWLGHRTRRQRLFGIFHQCRLYIVYANCARNVVGSDMRYMRWASHSSDMF